MRRIPARKCRLLHARAHPRAYGTEDGGTRFMIGGKIFQHASMDVMTEDTREHLHKLLSKFDNAILVTCTPEGRMHARPMAVAHISPGSDAFFVTSIQSPKVAEIEANPDVLVTFQGGGAYAAIGGRARVVRDKLLLERYWSSAWTAWFPGGVDDPDLCVIAVLADEGEYWDRAGVQSLRYAFAAAKAYVAGERPELGRDQHAKMKL
jgi:general stress protein 26